MEGKQHTDETLVKGISGFGCKLLEGLLQGKDQTVFVSPFSINQALLLAANGAQGETLCELMKTLELQGADLSEINGSVCQIAGRFSSLDSNEATVDVANGLWVSPKFQVKQEFVEMIKKSFLGESHTMKDTSDVNSWVSEETHGKITHILEKAESGPEVILANAIYFKALFATKFDPSETSDADFFSADGTKVPCRMMHQSSDMAYFENDHFQAVNLPYESSFVATIILPRSSSVKTRTVIDILKKDSLNFDSTQKVELHLPRFKIEYDTALPEVLKRMGLRRAFTSDAEFGKISDEKIFVSNVLHKTFLEVNEEGTEAAAATVVELARSVSPNVKPKVFVVKVDHPFFLLIREAKSDLVLFSGFIASV